MIPYTNNKIIHHTDRLYALHQGAQPAPVHVQLVVSNLCNHNCLFCAYRMPGYTSNQLFNKSQERILPKDKVLETIRSCSAIGVKAIQFTGGGEPTVHKHLPLFLSTAHQNNIETALVTNGQNLNIYIRQELLQSAWVRISLDSGTQEMHTRIRGLHRPVFNETIDNIKKLVTMRNTYNSQLYIGISFVITKDNWHEIADAAKLARDIGADSIRFAAIYTMEGAAYFDGIYNNVLVELDKASQYTTDTFDVINTFPERFDDLAQNPEYKMCIQQRVSTYIGADYNVYRCCILAYNNQGLLGSIKDQSFYRLWNSPETINKLNNLDPRNCPRCQFNGRNRAALKLIRVLPDKHINFI